MIGLVFRQFLYSTSGEMAFTVISAGTAYTLVNEPELVVGDSMKDWLLVVAFVIIAFIAIFRSSIFLYNSRYLKGLKFNFYKVQKSLLLASAIFFLSAVVFHLLR